MAGISHHLTDDLLMAYAAGTLPEAFSLVVATHISMCDECRARLGAYESVGGEVLESSDAVEMETGSFEILKARLNDAPQITVPTKTRANGFPQPLFDYAGDPNSVQWRKLGKGVKQAILPTSSEATARLLYIPGGVAVPDHGHQGQELTLVLSGAFRDETARFGPGDIEIANEDLDHTPTAEPGEPCICLTATDAPLKFNAMMPRILQPFFKI